MAVTTRKVPRNSPHGLRLAAVDIGTNSLHLVVVEVTDRLSFRVLASEKDLTQLGCEALVDHHLTTTAMDNTLRVLRRYQQIAARLECNELLAYATSAVRESSNGAEFVERVRQELNLTIRIISAQEEARLIYLAVRQAIDLGPGPSLIVDIGGGSAEFILSDAQKPLILESRKLGASRLSQLYIRSDPVNKSDLEALETHIRRVVKPIRQQLESFKIRRLIGTSGTIENLVAMSLAQHGEANVRHRLVTEMTADDFKLLYKTLLRSTLAERRKLPGLDPGRAGQIIAGAVLMNHLFERIELPTLEFCSRAMREGMILDYIDRHWPKVSLSMQIPDPRRRSVVELGSRCHWNDEHARQVSALALSIFDQTRRIHKLGTLHREYLEYAALLHDIGWHIGHSGHHKHSYYLVKNGDLEGFSPLEIDVMANVARYHRKSLPKKTHPPYMSLDIESRRVVNLLAGILRVADGLDRGHHNNIKAVHVQNHKGELHLSVESATDPDLELWAAQSKADLFKQAFGQVLHIQTP